MFAKTSSSPVESWQAVDATASSARPLHYREVEKSAFGILPRRRRPRPARATNFDLS